MQSAPLRCHLHLETIGQRTFRVVSPRPQDGLRISTNRYHDTWHIVCAPGHIRALRRLFWAMAFERHEGTLVALAGSTLAPTPFDAAPSLPVLIANADLTSLRHDDVRELLARLARRRSPDGSVKLQTFSLDGIDALERPAMLDWFAEQRRQRPGWEEPRVEQIGGAIAFYGPPPALRCAAASMHSLERPLRAGDSNYNYVGEYNDKGQPGEVQVFGDYPLMLSEARRAREVALPRSEGQTPDEQSYLIGLERLRLSGLRIARRGQGGP